MSWISHSLIPHQAPSTRPLTSSASSLPSPRRILWRPPHRILAGGPTGCGYATSRGSMGGGSRGVPNRRLTFPVQLEIVVPSEQARPREDLGQRLRSFFFWPRSPAPESQVAAHRKVTTRDAGNSF